MTRHADVALEHACDDHRITSRTAPDDYPATHATSSQIMRRTSLDDCMTRHADVALYAGRMRAGCSGGRRASAPSS